MCEGADGFFGLTGGLGLRLGDGFPVAFSGALKGQNITHSETVCTYIHDIFSKLVYV